MASYPTPSNPALFQLTKHVPALKNRRSPAPKEGGGLSFKKNPEVLKFIRNNHGLYQRQWLDQCETHGWSMIPLPQRVGFFAKIVFYRADRAKLPKSDGDNAYQTLQEMLMNIAIEDDRQVAWGNHLVEYTGNRALEGATAWLWLWEEGVDWKTQLMQLDTEIKMPQSLLPTLLQEMITGE